MDSPIRKALKRNDYLRHKLFRKIKRKQRSRVELDLKLAEKELKKRLRKPKFDGGTDDNRVKVTERTYPDGSVVYFADDGKTLTPINTMDSDDMSNWTWQDMDNPRVTYTGVSNIKDSGEIKQGEGPKSGLGRLHKKLYQVSNKHLQDPILGSYARFADSWDNDTNPIKAMWELPATKAALMEAAYAKTLLTAKNLSRLSVDYAKLGNMGLRELDEFFATHPSLITADKTALKFSSRYNDFVQNTIRPRYALAMQNAGRPYTKDIDDAIINTPEVLSADFGPYSKWGGYYTNNPNRIVLNSNPASSDSQIFGRIAHEKHHAYRDNLSKLNKFYPNKDILLGGESIANVARSGYTPEEMNALEAYQFTPEYLATHSALKPLAEKGATNGEIVARIAYDLGVSGHELDKAIKTMPRSSLVKYLNTNAYGRNFLKTPMTKEKEKAIRDALTTVASVSPFGLVYSNYGGGKDGISDDEYYRIMENVANLNYKSWGFDNPEDALVSALNDNTYDYRGFYNEFVNSNANAKTHWTDKYKTAYHPTFSEESKYSSNVSDYNPTGMRGGTWSKLRPVYRLSKDQMANNWDVNKTKLYLQREGVDVKTPYDPYMLLERTYKDGTKLYFDEEGQLLNPTTLGLIGGAASYSLPMPTPFADWKWQNSERPELNAYLRLGQYMLNAPARDIDKVMLGAMAAGIAPMAILASGATALASRLTPGSLFWTNPMTKSMIYGTAGATGADIAAKAVTGKTFEEWGERDLGLPWYLSGFVNPGGYLMPASEIRNMLKQPFIRTTSSQAAEQSIPQITAKNATKITPAQWTAAQDAAVARGDMAEAQRLRDLHFKVSAPNTQISESGVPLKVSHSTDAVFNTFDKNYWKYGAVGEGNYFGNGQSVFSHLPVRKDFYINQQKPLILDDVGREALFEDAITMSDDIINRGYDGVIVNYGPKHLSDFEMVEYNPKHIKLADAVTYDNNGVRIPLGDRDNFNINDIRWSWLLPTFGIGAAAYGAELYNSGKDVRIKPSKRGTFTAAAKKHGMSVQAYARKVLKAPKGKYSSAMRKKANFARVFGGRNY